MRPGTIRDTATYVNDTQPAQKSGADSLRTKTDSLALNS